MLDEKEELIKDVESMESELTGLSEDLSERRQKLKLQFQKQQMKSLFLKKKKARKDKIDLNIILFMIEMDARDGLAVVPIVDQDVAGGLYTSTNIDRSS